MDIKDAFREIIDERIAELGLANGHTAEPELMTVDETVDHLNRKVSRDTIYELHRHRETNGFPSTVLGAKNIFVDKRRLNRWLASGGSEVKAYLG